MKIKCGDIVFLPYVDEYEQRFGEIGPGKYKSDEHTVYEMYPLKLTDIIGTFEYATDSVFIDKKSIAEHHTVKDRADFILAWTSLGFDPIITDNNVTFSLMFEHTYEADSECVESLSSASSDDDDDVRSNDTYSTLLSDSSTDSFVITDTEDPQTPEICECSFCDTSSTNQWFDRQWNPTNGSEEHNIKSLIQNLEAKYT